MKLIKMPKSLTIVMEEVTNEYRPPLVYGEYFYSYSNFISVRSYAKNTRRLHRLDKCLTLDFFLAILPNESAFEEFELIANQKGENRLRKLSDDTWIEVILRSFQQDVTIESLCQQYGTSRSTFYRRKKHVLEAIADLSWHLQGKHYNRRIK